MLDAYVIALATAQTRRTYVSKVRQYLAWLASAQTDGDPLDTRDGRDWAVRDYRTYLQAVLKRRPATINNALAAIDDLYIRRHLGAASAARLELPATTPRALSQRDQLRYLRAVRASPSPRDQALALTPFYVGARISEIVGLDVDDVRLSARSLALRLREAPRRLPISRTGRVFLAVFSSDYLGDASVLIKRSDGRTATIRVTVKAVPI